MLLSIVVPCYNEEAVLRLFYEKTADAVRHVPADCEFIFINDGSRDKTLAILKEFAAADSRVRYLSFSRNFGKEAAMLAGLEASRGDLVAVMDADLQDPPGLLPRMADDIRNGGYDSVATRRVTRKGEPPIRSFFARQFYRIIRSMSNVNIVDGARDYRMMTRTMADAVVSLPERHRFSKGIFGWVGFNTEWIEYENTKRAAGETKWSFWKLFKYAIEGIVSFTTVPLRFASILGFAISAFTFCYLIVTLIKTVIFGPDVPGYPSLLVSILLLGGIQLIAIGVLGEYLARTYMEAKARPVYIVKEKNF